VPRSHHKCSSIRTGSRNVPRGWEDGQRAAPQMGQVRIVLAFAMANVLGYYVKWHLRYPKIDCQS